LAVHPGDVLSISSNQKVYEMIIPSIDLMSGRAVQLRQGREHVLTSDEDPIELAKRFNRYGPVAVIDLDAAMGTGDNLDLMQQICRVADVRAGGGIRTVERGMALLKAGAQSIIIGTAATPEFRGMQGLSMDAACELKRQLSLPVTFAGGVATTEEAVRLARAGLDVQVGMALYTGQLDLTQSVIDALDFKKMNGLIPTIVQDDVSSQVLMLAYSSPESLRHALEHGVGAYWSRSRNELWVKGATSGHAQELVSCRSDCDRDTLLFRIRQSGPACHTGSYSCFGPHQFTLDGLFENLQQTVADGRSGSYTRKLVQGRFLSIKKLLEEAVEVIFARGFDHTRWEAADVIYHLMPILIRRRVDWKDVVRELSARQRRK